jgi:hypothetical protein
MSLTNAQNKGEGKKSKKDSIWDIGMGLGVDGAQLLQLNPRVGSGQNRVGFGGAINFRIIPLFLNLAFKDWVLV